MSKERNLNFDEVIDRRGSHCLKYDFAVERGAVKPGESQDDLLSLWVADMDFRSSSFIQDALIKQAEHGVFGYSEVKDEYFKVVQSFYRRYHNYEIEDASWIVKTPGVVFVLAMAIKAFTRKGDAVLIQKPVYMHFAGLIKDTERRVVSNDLIQGEDGRYYIDFEDFEKKIVENDIKVFLLCSPHNPVCRVWTREELLRIGEICMKHHVLVVSDEIHSDFVYQGKHIVFASLSEEFAQNSITVTSPTKTFNIAGLQLSNAFIKNPEIRQAIIHEIDAVGYSQLNVMGLVATQAAYEHGEEWLDAVNKYIKGNIDYVEKFVKENLPQIKVVPTDCTYLMWLDFRGTGKTVAEQDELILRKAKLWINSGYKFGRIAAGFQRFNVACPRSILVEAMNRLKTVFG
ncbi:MalY/PatB family protein [Fibrobacter sp. UWEL]|uniref:MalY/PatB family protein n=1 Tax=Fibrobacter sp. UWEL TaxID=1896209 RepID=UPI0009156E91|nr:MalY/PatB family protein [Fibrobacter sp. UWEL]SHK82783.1 cystathione beta-lyase [Fibrobacter sp. UWEL]